MGTKEKAEAGAKSAFTSVGIHLLRSQVRNILLSKSISIIYGWTKK